MDRSSSAAGRPLRESVAGHPTAIGHGEGDVARLEVVRHCFRQVVSLRRGQQQDHRRRLLGRSELGPRHCRTPEVPPPVLFDDSGQRRDWQSTSHDALTQRYSLNSFQERKKKTFYDS